MSLSLLSSSKIWSYTWDTVLFVSPLYSHPSPWFYAQVGSSSWILSLSRGFTVNHSFHYYKRIQTQNHWGKYSTALMISIRRLSSGIRGLGSGIGGLGGGNWRLSSSIGGHTGIGDYGGLWCILEYLSSESHHLFVHCTQNPSKCITPLLAY